MRLKTGTLCAAVVLCASLPAGAQATTVASVTPSISHDRLGANTAATLAVRFTDTEGGLPVPLSRVVLRLPRGIGIDLRGIGTCSSSRLRTRGPRGCPASAEVGTGNALEGARLGVKTIDESATLTAFRGPNQGGHPTINIAGQGLSPLEERVVLTSVLMPDSPPYGMQLVTSVAPIPTLPTEPNASTIRFSLTLGATSHSHTLLRMPSSCPAGGFPFAADFTFVDGTTSDVLSKIRCP